MTTLETFLWGFAGSVAVEIVTVLRFYTSSSSRLPDRYRRVGFWITRMILAGMAGALAVGYEIQGRILAFNIGAATPLIITSLARGLRQPLEDPAPPVSQPPASPTRTPEKRAGVPTP